MEWYTILALFLLIVLFIILGVLLACMLAGQRCTISIQQRKPNHELTKIQQEEERKKQKKLSSKVKRAFSSSSKNDQPPAPVEDIKTVELTFKLGDDLKESEQVTVINEPALIPLTKPRVTQADIEARQKRRDDLRKKYNL